MSELELDNDSFIAAANRVIKGNKYCPYDFDQLVEIMVGQANECHEKGWPGVSTLGYHIDVCNGVASAWVDADLMEAC